MCFLQPVVVVSDFMCYLASAVIAPDFVGTNWAFFAGESNRRNVIWFVASCGALTWELRYASVKKCMLGVGVGEHHLLYAAMLLLFCMWLYMVLRLF